ncbi:Spc97/Spc98 family protein [Gregarina niphandrodes]|uniref:Spc97/Spc98 family protein n=1 Tax=Gregarina niphandrodes TaxID=110365 RepID=A0A023AYK1_GRENI|nr:Spc97/Spc98 family protein [Gregarina niphandrodes]EZG43741.1 Spc97/Spc98 family protein [Gregarina niphandrodes]|eukprot:XP_011133028.1 Spc97/Spc98 family protein [Gregarina niphandrodes]
MDELVYVARTGAVTAARADGKEPGLILTEGRPITKHVVKYGDHVMISCGADVRRLVQGDPDSVVYLEQDNCSRKSVLVYFNESASLGRAYASCSLRHEVECWKGRKEETEEAWTNFIRTQWFDPESYNTEFLIMPADLNALGKDVAFHQPCYLIMAPNVTEDRYFLTVSAEGAVCLVCGGDSEEQHLMWRFINHDCITSREPLTTQHSVYIQSLSGYMLAINDRYTVHTLLDVPIGQPICAKYTFILIRLFQSSTNFDPSYYESAFDDHGRLKVSESRPPEFITARIHYGQNSLRPEFITARVHYGQSSLRPESIMGLMEIDVLQLGVQELLLVEDALECLLGVPGEFERWTCHYPVGGGVPYFTHEYRTLAQQEGSRLQDWSYEMASKADVTPTFDSTLDLDRSLCGMMDKIMLIVNDLNSVRLVVKWHSEEPESATNACLGNAMRQILIQYERGVCEIRSCNEHGSLSLQKLYAILNSSRQVLHFLKTTATLTYGYTGLSLIDQVLQVHKESGASKLGAEFSQYLLRAACQPLERFVNLWLFSGELEDLYCEFFIVKNPRFDLPLNQTVRSVDRILAGSVDPVLTPLSQDADRSKGEVLFSERLANDLKSPPDELTELQQWLWWDYAFVLDGSKTCSLIQPYLKTLLIIGKLRNVLNLMRVRYYGARNDSCAQGENCAADKNVGNIPEQHGGDQHGRTQLQLVAQQGNDEKNPGVQSGGAESDSGVDKGVIRIGDSEFARRLEVLRSSICDSIMAYLNLDPLYPLKKVSPLGVFRNTSSMYFRDVMLELKQYFFIERADILEDLYTLPIHDYLLSSRPECLWSLLRFWSKAKLTSTYRRHGLLLALVFSTVSLHSIATRTRENHDKQDSDKPQSGTDRDWYQGSVRALSTTDFSRITQVPINSIVDSVILDYFACHHSCDRGEESSILLPEIGINLQKVTLYPKLPLPVPLLVLDRRAFITLQSTFRLLFILHYLRNRMEQLWLSISRVDHDVRAPLLIVASHTRELFMATIKNLIDYVTSDVIRPQNDPMTNCLKQDYNAIRTTWSDSLAAIAQGLFLYDAVVQLHFAGLFKLAHDFAFQLNTLLDYGMVGYEEDEDESPLYSAEHLASVEKLDHDYRSVVSALIVYLKRVNNNVSRILLNRLSIDPRSVSLVAH